VDYAEAVKKVWAEKPKDNYMVIEFGYDCKFVLPHKYGVALIESMTNAERIADSYHDPKRISELPRDAVKSTLMSHQEYERFKIAALLNLAPEEVKEAQEKATQPPPPPPSNPNTP